jgi:hypothetical protein
MAAAGSFLMAASEAWAAVSGVVVGRRRKAGLLQCGGGAM